MPVPGAIPPALLGAEWLRTLRVLDRPETEYAIRFGVSGLHHTAGASLTIFYRCAHEVTTGVSHNLRSSGINLRFNRIVSVLGPAMKRRR